MIGELYFYDTVTKEYSPLIDWKDYSDTHSFSCVEMYIGDRIEEITGWEFNLKLFGNSTSLLLAGKAAYGKRAWIYDIDHKNNIDIRRHINIDNVIDEKDSTRAKPPQDLRLF